MLVKNAEARQQAEVVATLLEQAAATLDDRRTEQRHPFFRPVTICGSAQNIGEISGYTKDLSAGGVGVLTNSPLPKVPVRLSLPDPLEVPVELLGEVVWTAACGEGWYASGIRFCE